jgi:hypothetical protein
MRTSRREGAKELLESLYAVLLLSIEDAVGDSVASIDSEPAGAAYAYTRLERQYRCYRNGGEDSLLPSATW